MKNKIFYIITIIFCIGISSGITYFVVEDKFKQIEIDQNKTITEVNIKEENTIKPAVEKIKDSVILVETYYNERGIGSGTGFIYKTDDKYGYILTCHHVIAGSNRVIVTNNDGQTVDATVLGSDEFADIAVLRIDKDAVMSVAEIGSSANLEIGDTLFSIGSPLGEEYMGTVTRGILSGKDRTVSVDLSSGSFRMDVLQTDAAINPGNSGGPLVNINGEVVGVISLKLAEEAIEGMGFAIPIEVVMSATSQLEKGEAMIRPVIGVELIDVTSTYGLYLYKINLDSSIKNGVVVTKVEEGYPASKVGLQKGDVIVEIDGNKIEDFSHFRYILYKYNINDTIKLTVMRGSKEMTFDLKLEKTA